MHSFVSSCCARASAANIPDLMAAWLPLIFCDIQKACAIADEQASRKSQARERVQSRLQPKLVRRRKFVSPPSIKVLNKGGFYDVAFPRREKDRGFW